MKKFFLAKEFSLFALLSLSLNANISGIVYKDFNLNGTIDNNDIPVANVEINATCNDGTQKSVLTNSNGKYTIEGIEKGAKCLIIANAKNAALYAAENASGNSGTLVDIVTDGETHNISLASPSTYCQSNPKTVIAALPGYYTEWYKGVYGGGGIEPEGFGTLYTVPNPTDGNFNGQESIQNLRKTLSKFEDTGAIWGVAYKRTSKELFVSTVIKRYVPFKDDDVSNAGNIYKITDINGTPKISKFVTIPNVLSANAISDLSNRDYSQNQDQDVWKKYAAREGIGDIDISEDDSKLYVMNMNTKSIVVVDTNTGEILKTSKLPNPYGAACEDEMVRPWALKVKGNSIYVGSVCENKIKDPFGNRIGASIQKCDLNAQNCKEVARTNALTYLKPRGYRPADAPSKGAYNYTNWTTYGKGDYKYGPILTDIEFTNRGDLVLGYTARNSFVRTAGLNGDVRKLCLQSDGTYVDEINDDGTPSAICKPHALKYDQEGKNSETYYEFYTGDYAGDDYGAYSHTEIAYGALAQIPGMPYLTVGAIAANVNYEPGALVLLSNKDGDKKGTQSVIKSAYVNKGGEREPYGSKSGGIGDIELLCDAAPIEIGDYVWMDMNENGIQEADEPAMVDVPVKLYCQENGTNVYYGETKTDTKGHYYFGGLNNVNLEEGKSLKSDMKCELVISKSSVNNKGVTVTNADNNSKDSIDNDAKETDKNNILTFNTTVYNNHSLDFGIKPAYDCIKGVVFEDINGNGLNDDNATINGALLEIYDESGNIAKDANGTEFKAYTTTEDGRYEFCNVVLNQNYTIHITPPQGYYLTKKVEEEENKNSDFDQNSSQAKTDYSKGLLELDAGLFKPACIGDYAFIDTNANGVQDSEDTPLSGVKVSLLDKNGSKVVDLNGKVAETVTDSNGKYTICNIVPGVYKVKFEITSNDAHFYLSTQKDATNDANDSDIEEGVVAKGVTEDMTIKSGEVNNSIDAGFIKNICIGDIVWYDRNLNGIQDEDLNSDAVIDVKVSLYDENGNLIKSTVTDQNGKYKFCNLDPAKSYKLKFDIPQTYLATPKNKGDFAEDSDANSNGWVTINANTLSSHLQKFNNGDKVIGLINPTFDLGIYCSCDDYKVHPQNYKKLSASALNTLAALALLFIFGVLSSKRD